MNNLAYTSQDAAYVGSKVEEKVREEVSATAPLTYQVETGEAGTATIGSFLSDIGSGLIGGKDETLFRFNFDLTQRRPATLQVSINRQGRRIARGTIDVFDQTGETGCRRGRAGRSEVLRQVKVRGRRNRRCENERQWRSDQAS